MKSGFASWILAGILLSGCGSRTSDKSGRITPETPPAPRVSATYEALRSASFQVAAATESLAKALEAVRAAKATARSAAKEGLAEAEDLLDGVGEAIAEHTEPPSEVESTAEKEPELTKRMEAARTVLEDSLYDAEEASGILGSLTEAASQKSKPWLQEAWNLSRDAVEDLRSAFLALGGKTP